MNCYTRLYIMQTCTHSFRYCSIGLPVLMSEVGHVLRNSAERFPIAVEHLGLVCVLRAAEHQKSEGRGGEGMYSGQKE